MTLRKHTMRDLLSKLDKILLESAENTDANTQGKRKALQDIEKIPAAKDPEIKRAIDAKKAELGQEDSQANKDVAEGYRELDALKEKLSSLMIKAYDQANSRDEIIDIAKPMAIKIAQSMGLSPDSEEFKIAWSSVLGDYDQETNFGDNHDSFDYTDYSMRKGEKGVADDFQIGDEFGISFNEDFEIGSTIVGIVEDGIVIELDDRAFEFLTNEGWTFEDGEIVNEEKIKGVDGKACWKGKRYAGKVKKADGTYKDKCVAEGVALPDISGLGYNAQSLIMKLRRDVEEKRLQPTRQAVLMAARELAGDMDFAPELLVRQVLGQGVSEAEYQGRNVPLGKPMAGDVKKSKVYVKNPQGNVVKVNFGDKKMRIKKSIPSRRKSFRARHNCSNPGPRHKARYWSCRAW
jgi:hypothetical protein